jgi:hypothetical protein
MDSVIDYLNAAKARLGLKSDRELGRALGQTPEWTHAIRAGKTLPSDESMYRLAELAGVDPTISLLKLNQWKARSPSVSQAYSSLIQRLAVALAAIALVMVDSSSVLASTITEHPDTQVKQHYILSQIRRMARKINTLTRWLQCLSPVPAPVRMIGQQCCPIQ